MVNGSRRRRRAAIGQDTSGEGAFWLKPAVAATKNAIVGYLSTVMGITSVSPV